MDALDGHNVALLLIIEQGAVRDALQERLTYPFPDSRPIEWTPHDAWTTPNGADAPDVVWRAGSDQDDEEVERPLKTTHAAPGLVRTSRDDASPQRDVLQVGADGRARRGMPGRELVPQLKAAGQGRRGTEESQHG